MAGHSASEDARERTYARPSTLYSEGLATKDVDARAKRGHDVRR